MANILPMHVRVSIIRHLCEGTSIRATARLTNTKKSTVMRLALLVGLGSLKLHEANVHGNSSHYYECDEIWTYVGKHEKRKTKFDPKHWGDVYTLFALDHDTKLITSYATGKRTLATATRMMKDLRKRVKGKPQISVDAWPDWIEAVRRTFGHNGVHLGVVVKEFAKKKDNRDPVRRYAPSRLKSIKKIVIYGHPETEMISTSLAERVNMTGRMQMRRLTRLTNAYSKKTTPLTAAVGLHFMWYNFVRVNEAIKTTPAVKAGMADHRWTYQELVLEALAAMGKSPPKPPVKTYPSTYKRKRHVLVSVA
jgi:transposase-like protein